MPKPRAIFFWMGDLFAPSIHSILQARFTGENGRLAVNLLAQADFQQALSQLRLGQISDLDFCAQASRLSEGQVSPEGMRRLILAGVRLNRPMLLAVDPLPAEYQRWLVVDYPAAWMENLPIQAELGAVFPREHWVFLDQSGLTRLIPEVFYSLAQRAGISIDQGLLLDASSKRTVAALRQGMPAELIVDSRRLARELIMRYLVPQPIPVHQPGVNIYWNNTQDL